MLFQVIQRTAFWAVGTTAAIKAVKAIAALTREKHISNPNRPVQECAGLNTRSFVNKDGLIINFRVAQPSGDTEVIGLVILVHGYAEHAGRYHHVIAALNRAGFVVYAPDHQGHGASEGDRAHMVRFADLADDILQMTSIAQKRHPELRNRTFLLGHSMGGAVSILATQKGAESDGPSPFAGTVLSAPAIAIDPAVATPVKVAMANALSALLPKLKLDGLDPTKVSKDAAVVDAYCNDPLVYRGGMRVRLAAETIATIKAIEEFTPSVQWPYLLMHGTADKLCAIDGARKFFANSSSPDKTFKEFDGYFHEIFNEPDERDSLGVNPATRKAVAWLEERARARM